MPSILRRRWRKMVAANPVVLVALIVASLIVAYKNHQTRTAECRNAGVVRQVLDDRRHLDATGADRSRRAAAFWLGLGFGEATKIGAFIRSDANLRVETARSLDTEATKVEALMQRIGC